MATEQSPADITYGYLAKHPEIQPSIEAALNKALDAFSPEPLRLMARFMLEESDRIYGMSSPASVVPDPTPIEVSAKAIDEPTSGELAPKYESKRSDDLDVQVMESLEKPAVEPVAEVVEAPAAEVAEEAQVEAPMEEVPVEPVAEVVAEEAPAVVSDEVPSAVPEPEVPAEPTPAVEEAGEAVMETPPAAAEASATPHGEAAEAPEAA